MEISRNKSLFMFHIWTIDIWKICTKANDINYNGKFDHACKPPKKHFLLT